MEESIIGQLLFLTNKKITAAKDSFIKSAEVKKNKLYSNIIII